jgi:tetratricopeptide (TPR) repeat protein
LTKASPRHANLGKVLANLGNRREAETAYHRAQAILEKLVAELPTVAAYRHELTLSYSGLAVLLTKQGKFEDSKTPFRQALVMREKLAADLPDASRRHGWRGSGRPRTLEAVSRPP